MSTGGPWPMPCICGSGAAELVLRSVVPMASSFYSFDGRPPDIFSKKRPIVFGTTVVHVHLLCRNCGAVAFAMQFSFNFSSLGPLARLVSTFMRSSRVCTVSEGRMTENEFVEVRGKFPNGYRFSFIVYVLPHTTTVEQLKRDVAKGCGHSSPASVKMFKSDRAAPTVPIGPELTDLDATVAAAIPSLNIFVEAGS